MGIALYFDVHIPKQIATGLRVRGVDVLTAQEDGTSTLPDPELLDRATELGRPLFTCDDDLLAEAKHRQAEGIDFAGVIYIRLLKISIGQCVRDLELIAKAGEPEDLRNHIQFLPF
jgi:predicted nuclease of predicted toxin-antitoxin system